MPAVRLFLRKAAGTFMCGLDSDISGFERSSTARGWFWMNSSISRSKSSAGTNMVRVSASVGGLRNSVAALIAGMAAIRKPAVVKTAAIATNLIVLRKRDFGRGGREANRKRC